MKPIYGITMVISLLGASAQAQLPLPLGTSAADKGIVGGSLSRLAVVGTEALGGVGFWSIEKSTTSNGHLAKWYEGVEDGLPGTGRFWNGLRDGIAANPDTTTIWWQILLRHHTNSDEVTARDILWLEAVSAGIRYECPDCTIVVSHAPDFWPRSRCPSVGTYDATVAMAEYVLANGLGDVRGPSVGSINFYNDSSNEGGNSCHQGLKGQLEHGLALVNFWSDE